jgi:LmbE family N-acetylglucosaminyl deacetylase
MHTFKRILFFLSLFHTFPTGAQQTPGEIILGLQKLNTTGTVLYIAAHPDDENTKLLAYLANERHLRTGYLSLTRGDGGQNLIGKEQGEMLGLLRTQELLAARRIDGAEQFFTRANDFGFSKNPEETFSIWNRDSILADVVWAIRKFRPDIIICRFPTTGEGGHGHHTASAILAAEAFDAAADPKRFPDQLAYVSTWQPRRLFWNTFNFGGLDMTAPNQIKINVGGYNPLLGKSYGEIASESRSMHKSQGFGTAKTRGESFEFFKQLRGDSVKQDLFEGINQQWTRVPQPAAISTQPAAAAKGFNPMKAEASVPALVAVYKSLQGVKSNDPAVVYWQQLKLQETQQLILACAGIWLEATATDYIAIPGNNISIKTQVISLKGTKATLQKISLATAGGTVIPLSSNGPLSDLKNNVLDTFNYTITLPAATRSTNPYWLTQRYQVSTYVVDDPMLIGKAENDDNPKVIFDLSVAGLPLRIERTLRYKSVDPVKGEIYRPLEILPPVTIELSSRVLVFSDTSSRQLAITVRANQPNVAGRLSIITPNGWNVRIDNPEINIAKKGDEVTINATIRGGESSANGKLDVTVTIDGKAYNKSIRRLNYDHIPAQFALADAEATLVNIDLKKRGTNIGYIPGAGDDVAACLTLVGYNVTTLTDEILASGNLDHYDAIVTGVRAYNVNDRLHRYHNHLMEYVKAGGNFIVQYNTNTRLGPMATDPGPYPFKLANLRVTDESAAVTFSNPKSPALNYPNRITEKDFKGWIQERGIYFATDTDPKYDKPLAMNDRGEKPLDGSLIIAPYGKGNFVYTGLVFFRQLPAGNPGAYRLFVNLLSLPQHEPRQ